MVGRDLVRDRERTAARESPKKKFGKQHIEQLDRVLFLKIIKALRDDNSGGKLNAMFASMRMLERGVDLTPVVPALTKALEDDDLLVKGQAVSVLTYQYMDKGKINEVKKLALNTSSLFTVPSRVFRSLAVISKESDIGNMVDFLEESFTRVNDNLVRESIAEALVYQYSREGNKEKINELKRTAGPAIAGVNRALDYKAMKIQ